MYTVAPAFPGASVITLSSRERLPAPFSVPSNVVLLHGDVPALIDTGLAACQDALIAALGGLGLEPSQIGKVLLTSLLPEAVGNLELFEYATVHAVGVDVPVFALRDHLRAHRAALESTAVALLDGPEGHDAWDRDEIELGLDVVYFGPPAHATVVPVDDGQAVRAAGGEWVAVSAPGVDAAAAGWFQSHAGALVGGESLSSVPRARVEDGAAYRASLGRLASTGCAVAVGARGPVSRSPQTLFRVLSLGVANLAQNIPFALDGPTSPVQIAFRDYGYWPRDVIEFADAVVRYQRVLDEMLEFGVASREGEGPWARYSMDRPSRT